MTPEQLTHLFKAHKKLIEAIKELKDFSLLPETSTRTPKLDELSLDFRSKISELHTKLYNKFKLYSFDYKHNHSDES